VPVLQEYNCFVLDFFKMDPPNTDHLAYDNQMKDVWHQIEAFSLNLRVLATALTKLHTLEQMDANLFRMMKESEKDEEILLVKGEDKESKLCRAFQRLAQNFKMKFNATKR
jgi:hypothetical protein